MANANAEKEVVERELYAEVFGEGTICTNEPQLMKKLQSVFDKLVSTEQARRESEAKLEQAVAAEREANCKAMCQCCREGTRHNGLTESDDPVNPVPYRIEKQYVPNCGEREGWVHGTGWGTLIQCEAGPIYEAARGVK
jgi:hypothetical protein